MARLKIYRSKKKYAAKCAFGEALGEFKASGEGKQTKSRIMKKRILELKEAINRHLRRSNVQKFLLDFMKTARRAALAEKKVTESVEIFEKTVQKQQWHCVGDSSDGGRSSDFVFLKEPEVEPVGPNSGEDTAFARNRNEVASDAKVLVRDAFDYDRKAFKRNCDSFANTGNPRKMRKAVSYEDRLLVDKLDGEVYPGRGENDIIYEFGTRLTRTKS